MGEDNTADLVDRRVWVAAARRGIEYHHPEPVNVTTCGRTTRYGQVLPHGDVVDHFGSKPCRRCYPDGSPRASAPPKVRVLSDHDRR